MKVEQKKATFDPIVVTLESQFEVNVFRLVAGKVGGISQARNVVDELFMSLEPFETMNNVRMEVGNITLDEEVSKFINDHS